MSDAIVIVGVAVWLAATVAFAEICDRLMEKRP